MIFEKLGYKICNKLLFWFKEEYNKGIGLRVKKILVLNASQSKTGTVRGMIDMLVEVLGAENKVNVQNFLDDVSGEWNYEDAGDCDYSLLYFDLKKLTYKGCIDCGFCKKHKRCMLKDDIKFMYRYFDEADYILLGSPIYFGGTPSKLKALIDRCQAIYHSKYTLRDSMIDTSKKRKAFNILMGGEMLRDDLFFAMKHELGYFYKSINASEIEYIEIGNTDNVNPNEDDELKRGILDKFNKFLIG